MSSKPAFRDDIYESYTRKCLVLPSEGSEPRLVDMTIRTTTQDDISRIYSRTLDLRVSYGIEYRKTRVWPASNVIPGKHLLYFNMSPKLPLNRCLARILYTNPDNLESKLFWRGDVVMMRYESQDDIYINCQNADVSSTGALEEMLRDAYMTGCLERELSQDESQCKWNSDVVVCRFDLLIGEFYSLRYCLGTTRLHATFTRYHSYWGKDWRRKEGSTSPISSAICSDPLQLIFWIILTN